MMINSSRRRSLILSSREDEERKKASACGASARASDAFWKRLSAEKKFLLFLWKKVEKKKFFVSLPSLINTPLRGNRREATTHQRHNKTMSAVKKLIPLMDRVLVERAVAATKTSGGILLPETVGSKVRRMNSHSHSSSLSSLVFFLWISILVYRLLGWERERESAPHWEDVLFKSWNGWWWWTRFLFFMMSRALAFLRVTDDWMMFLSFFLVLLNNYSSTPASSSPSDRGDRVQWTGN